MYLKMLAIEASEKAILPKDLIFRWTAHHVKEIFVELLPPKFNLDGSSKVQITCGLCEAKQKYRQILGTSEYCVESFDFQTYYDSSAHEREMQILRVLENSLCDIAELRGNDNAVIINTAAEVRRINFFLKKRISKLSKAVDNVKINVYRNLSKEGGETWILEFVDKANNVLHESLIGKYPHYLDMRDVYIKSSIEGNDFVLYNKIGKEIYRHKVLKNK